MIRRNYSVYYTCLFIYVGYTFIGITCYNLEDKLPLFKFGDDGSNFGFSVAQHKVTRETVSGVTGSVLVVGAPTAKGDGSISRSGGVYYCPVSTNPTDCKRVPLDIYSGDGGRNVMFNSKQWLGVSLRSQGPGQFLVTCAHRYGWQSGSSDDEEEYVCGKCFLMEGRNTGEIVEVSRTNSSLNKDFVSSPCDYLQSRGRRIDTKKRFGYMQAGTSISTLNSEYLLGGPGAWRWSGSLFDIEMPQWRETEPLPSFDRNPDVNWTMTCPISEWRGQSNKAKCNDFPLNRDSYMGISVAMSNSISASKEMFYIAGAPRGNDTGAVVFFRTEGRVGEASLQSDESNLILGDAVSSSFGYSIATTDINGDGLDDLIVGAPQYYERSPMRKAGGAVYVYTNAVGKGFKLIEPKILYGPPNSNFGYAVAAIGDIDQDGYNDFAVGAPYQDDHGAVHVYRGSPSGSIRKSQTVSGRDYLTFVQSSNRNLVGFGASFSGIVDSDNNRYPDFLIGSFSDHVTLLRSRPIINVSMTFHINEEEIDLDAKNCGFAGGSWSCFRVEYCFLYRTRHVDYTEDVEISYILVADSGMQELGRTPRVALGNSRSNILKNTTTLSSSNEMKCLTQTLDARFLDQMKDHLTEIEVKLEFDLVLPELKRERRGAPVFNLIKDPILDAGINKTSTKVVKIKNNCSSDVCQSDLKFNASMPDEIVLGRTQSLPVNVSIANHAEDAHQARFTLIIPKDTTYSSSVVDKTTNITCGQVASDLLECEIGNPFKAGEVAVLTVNFDVSRVNWTQKQIQTTLQGYTSSDNPEIADIVLKAKIVLELDIVITGNSNPEQVRYKQGEILGASIMNKTDDIGSRVIHHLDVTNRGTRPAPGLSMNIALPSEIHNGKWLLYLVAAEVTPKSGGSCSTGNGNINALELQPPFVELSRSKRALNLRTIFTPGFRDKFQATLKCGQGARCVNIVCSLEELAANERVSIELYTRLWEATFLEEEALRRLDLVHIDTSSHVTTQFENVRLNANVAKIRTTVDHPFFNDDIVSAFPWWYIVIAIIILLLIYILIIFILVRCGFFKRKRYPRTDEGNEDATVHSVQEQSSA